MNKRRTLRQKLKAQRQEEQPVTKTVKVHTAGEEKYFRKDLIKSLSIIGLMFALELAWWYFSNR
jgi:hypothetical protein